MADMAGAVRAVRDQVPAKGRLVFVSGFFNIIHPGHLRLLRFAAECGDYLVVGVNPGGPEAGLLQDSIRLEGIQAISLVDQALVLTEPPQDFIARLKPQVVVKGKEHEDQWNPEADAVAAYGGRILFGSGDMSFSLVELLQGEAAAPGGRGFLRDKGFMRRHAFDPRDMAAVLGRFSQLRVLVVGDSIVDEYITCDSLGMSREDPTLVVTPVGTELFIGGAGIVAAHAANLGARVEFFSIIGGDDMGGFARTQLDRFQVHHHLLVDDSRPTILKQRFRSSGKTLLRVNHLRSHPIGLDLQQQILERIMARLSRTDLLIFSDFNYGCLPQALVAQIIDACREMGVMMVADSQSSSQVGDVSRFTQMALMTPTEREARLALKDFESGLVVLAEKLRKKSGAKNIFITLDKEGVLVHAGKPQGRGFVTDRLGAMNPMAVDPAGAGDSLLTGASLALAVGADVWQGAYIGSIAAACQVGEKGNFPLTLEKMRSLFFLGP